MNRRDFVRRSTGALACAPLYRAMAAEAPLPKAALDRIGMTTVVIRERFPMTRTEGKPAPLGGDLTLVTAPNFMVDQLGIYNVEIWSNHFEEQSLDYCKRIRQAASDAGARITNLQLDARYNLADPDAAGRGASVQMVKEWIDRAVAVGSPRLRANTGRVGPDGKVDIIVDSFGQLAEYGAKNGVTILVENHGTPIEAVAAIVKAVNSTHCKALADWGNSRATTEQGRIEELSKMFPYLGFVSAKALEFDAQNKHTSYDIVPIVKATEASGYKGIYSIEMWTNHNPPSDPVAAARTMMRQIAANLNLG